MKVPPFPKEVRIENTNYCNANCTICPREKQTRPKGYMDFDLFKSIIDQCAAHGVREVHLQGYGEPLLDEKIFDRIKYVRDAGITKTLMVTNAALLNEENAKKLIASGLANLKISFYGTTKEEYEKIHRGLNYDEVKANIEKLFELQEPLRQPLPIVSMKYIGEIWKFPVFVWQWGKHAKVTCARLHNYAGGRDYNSIKESKAKRVCRFLREWVLQVLWDGRVVPCCYDFNGEIILGDLNKNTIAEIWNGEDFHNFRQLHTEFRFDEIPLCKHCDKLK